MARLRTIPVNNLGGGCNDFNAPDGIADNEMQTSSRNIRGDAEFFTTRKGYVTTLSTLTGNSNGLRNVSVYYAKSDSDDKLFTVYGTTMYQGFPETNPQWTSLGASLLTNSDRINTVSGVNGWMFIFNGVDKPLRWDGTIAPTQPFTKPDSIASASNFKPTFGDVYLGRLFVGGVPIAPNSVFISKASSTANPEYIYDFGGTIASGIADANEVVLDNRVTAIRKLSNAVVMFTADGAWYVSGFQDIDSGVEPIRNSIPGAVGAERHEATVIVNNDIYYLTPNKEIRSIRRSIANSEAFDAVSLSRKIQRFLNEQIDDDLSTAWGMYDPVAREVHFYLRLKGSAINTIRIVGDMDKIDEMGCPAWYIDNNVPFRSGCFYRGRRYVGSATLGQLYLDDEGTADDDNAAIVARRVSKEYVLNDQLLLKNWKGVHIAGEITETTELTISLYIDDVIVTSNTVNINNVPANVPISGIGVDETGDFEIGDESEDVTPYSTDYYPFSLRIPCRRRGKKLVVVVESDGNSNDYKITSMNLFTVETTPFQYSLSERT